MPTFEQFTTANAASVTIPAETQVGDLLVAVLITDDGDVSISQPAGWTRLQSRIAVDNDHAVIDYKLAEAGDAGSTLSYTVNTLGAANEVGILLARISGVDPAAPVNGYAIEEPEANADRSTCPSVTTTADGCLLLRGELQNDDNAVLTPASHTLVGQFASDAGDDFSTALFYQTANQVSAGATGTVEIVKDGGLNKRRRGFTVAVAPLTPPAAPSDLSAVAASASRINLAWTDNATNESGVEVERKSGGGAFANVATLGEGVTTYSSEGLAAGTTYTYRVRATNAAGSSAYSAEASATTNMPPGAGGVDSMENRRMLKP